MVQTLRVRDVTLLFALALDIQDASEDILNVHRKGLRDSCTTPNYTLEVREWGSILPGSPRYVCQEASST